MKNTVQSLANTFSKDSQLIESLKAAIKTQIEIGDPSISRFNQAIDLLIKQNIKPILDQAKGKMTTVSDSNTSDIKDHFCRGRKWVIIPSEIIENEEQTDNPLYQTAVDLARENDFDELVELWDSAGFAWVRFHSPKGLLVNFSIHPNSSVGSNVKFQVDQQTAFGLEILNGTPKSNGYEQKSIPKKVDEEPVKDNTETVEPDSTNEVQDQVQDQNDDSQNDETEIPNESVPSNEALINELLNEDLNDDMGLDIDSDFDIDNI